ncbi:unnamed protein product [Bemisia tabaci]|uniref:Uncharacterized protein n=1 Tax=Bemisia tabaci TaxID=7038 RepID=A0A9P0ACN1_BEMTA|nr:unnamed protein product [Bemisia tabaci]
MSLRVLLVLIFAKIATSAHYGKYTEKIYLRPLLDRLGCRTNSTVPPSREVTVEKLAKLRHEMTENKIDAYIVPYADDHQNEFVALADRRLQYISGFSGSAGKAIITADKAALQTDVRYFEQADQQLDCQWTLITEQGWMAIAKWLLEELGEGTTVGADPAKIPALSWIQMGKFFAQNKMTLKVMTYNFVDKIWTHRPFYSNSLVGFHPVQYAGERWQSKVRRLRDWMKNESLDLHVVTALDDIAWLLNLRGRDLPTTPVFHSYVVIDLYSAYMYLPRPKITPILKSYLFDPPEQVNIKPFEEFWPDLANFGKNAVNVSLPDDSSFLIAAWIPPNKRRFSLSPIVNMKAYKNSVEAEGMKNAHIYDGVALCQCLSLIERGVAAGEYWDELKVAATLEVLRNEQPLAQGISFDSIVAFGEHSSMAHFMPSLKTNKQIDNSSLLMIDSGGQYLDGTTDVTRTIHLGTPTSEQRAVYTALLKGCINLATTKFARGMRIWDLEIIVKAPLHELGLDYSHGTTHGIGSFLNVHERFNWTFHPNFFGTVEPGYYEIGQWGMRLENVVQVVPAEVTFKGKNNEVLAFETVTLAPYDRKLIDLKMLDDKHIYWLNKYHDKVRNTVGKIISKIGRRVDYEWLMEATKPIHYRTKIVTLNLHD